MFAGIYARNFICWAAMPAVVLLAILYKTPNKKEDNKKKLG